MSLFGDSLSLEAVDQEKSLEYLCPQAEVPAAHLLALVLPAVTVTVSWGPQMHEITESLDPYKQVRCETSLMGANQSRKSPLLDC